MRFSNSLDLPQEMTKLSVEPFEGRWHRGLVVGICELLDGDLLEVLSHDLFGEIIVQDVVVD